MLRNILNHLMNTVSTDAEKTRLAAEFLARRIIELIYIEIDPNDYPELFLIFVENLKADGANCLIIPDMDYNDIWYTSDFRLITLCHTLNIGDVTLPHWAENDNKDSKYIELTREELATIYFLVFINMVTEHEESQARKLKKDDETKLIECLKILDVDSDVSFQEIKKIYKELVQVWHPDRFANNPSLAGRATEKLKEINGAYSYISQYFKGK